MDNFAARARAFGSVLLLLMTLMAGLMTKNVGRYYTDAEAEEFSAAAKDAGAGMVIAIGGGFDTQEHFQPLIDIVLEHAGKATPKLLFVPTAARDSLDGYEDKISWFESAGFEVDYLFVTTASPEEVAQKVESADVIYETGGNLQFLTENWSGKGMYGAVRAAFERGAVLMGVSSGAMCWGARGWDDFGPDVVRVTGSFPFVGRASGYGYCDCAGIIPFCVCPHFDNVGWRMYAFEALKLDIPSLCIENGAAVVFSGGEYRVVSDAAHPLRKAYLFVPDRGIVMLDVKKAPVFLALADGEYRVLPGTEG
ncbi:MAG: Type 1 glutamine amidotransferase-like domain-containing protein [Clostridia bacterium]|nr:Type 1 glutamine amidotransferase-like domain-containing protein [Clostridia bacterium]